MGEVESTQNQIGVGCAPKCSLHCFVCTNWRMFSAVLETCVYVRVILARLRNGVCMTWYVYVHGCECACICTCAWMCIYWLVMAIMRRAFPESDMCALNKPTSSNAWMYSVWFLWCSECLGVSNLHLNVVCAQVWAPVAARHGPRRSEDGERGGGRRLKE